MTWTNFKMFGNVILEHCLAYISQSKLIKLRRNGKNLINVN